MTTELVSVVVPVFNVGAHLERCVRSLLDQSYSHLEIILVNDGSTDDSAKIAAGFAQQDRRVVLVDQENAGVSAARNRGIDIARGEYLAFVDADDWLEPQTYERLVRKLSDDKLDFVTFGYTVDWEGHSEPGVDLVSFEGRLGTERGLQTVMATRNRFVFSRVYRRGLVGGTRFRNNLHWGEDTVFVVEVAKKSRFSAVVNERFYHYVQSEGSATRSVWNPKRLSGIRMTQVLEELLQQEHPDLVAYALEMRVDIVSLLVEDAMQLPRAERTEQVRVLRQTIRADIARILKGPALSTRTKIKALGLATAPRGLAAFRSTVHRLRGQSR